MRLSLLNLVIKSLRFRKLSVSLTIFSIALSVILLLGVDTIRMQAKNNFINTISGTDLIVGSRSGSIQLLLYTIFHLGNATNNVSWQSYEKIVKHPRVEWSIPISLGDSHKGFRVIGTNANYFSHYRYAKSKPLSFADGAEFSSLFEVVLGANVANKLNYQINDKITLAHGTGNTSISTHDNLPFTVSGILDKTGTPVDDSLLVTLAGIEAVHIGWESGVANKEKINTQDLNSADPRLQPKSITAFLIGLKSKQDIFGIQRAINKYKNEPLLAIIPGIALLELWKVVNVIEKILFVISLFVVVISLFGMLSIILSSLNERRRELAVLRSVGASPLTIFVLLVIESEFLVLLGIIFGVILLYLGILLLNPLLYQSFGIIIELVPPSLFQWKLILFILLSGLIIALIPARNAYRKTLQDGLTIRT
jgi:putative ABC transport system permease protein